MFTIKNSIVVVISFILAFAIQASAYAATYTAVSSGNWTSSNTWDLNGVPSANDNIIIPGAYTVYVNSNGQGFYLEGSHILVYGTLHFEVNGRINLDINGAFYIIGQGQIMSNSTGASLITINGENKWQGNDGTVTAERAITHESDPGQSPNFTTPVPPEALLPIDLIYFRAELKDASTVLLEWATASEENNDYFMIQRSSNGRDWETINEIDGALNSHTTTEYQAYDNKPLRGTICYRLVQVDTDGSFTTFKVVVIKNELTTEASVYPNPSRGVFNFSHDTFGNKNSTIKIFNANGQLVEQVTNSDKIATIDLTERENGVYIYQVEDQNGILSSGMIMKN